MSGTEIDLWLPTVVAFLISMLTSTGGMTGAFVILPFQISELGYATPGVSATNLLYSVVAVPLGAWRFHRERRLQWGLALTSVLGTAPGLVIGAYIHINYLPNPRSFKLFAGIVLLALAAKMVTDMIAKRKREAQPIPSDLRVYPVKHSLREILYQFDGQTYRVPTVPLVLFSLIVGVVGGMYGSGGAAILSPYLVAVYGLPVHSIAGAMLFSSWVTAVVGVIVYVVIGTWFAPGGSTLTLCWQLGLALGVGGLVGIYVGARLQKIMPAKVIKTILTLGLLLIAGKYIIGFFSG